MSKHVCIRVQFSLLIGLIPCLLLCACGSSSHLVSLSAANPTLPIHTTSFSGNAQTVLTDARGFTLYFYIPDTPTKTACTGVCAKNWPPLLATVSSRVTSTTPLPGKLTVQHTANGNQVEYNKHLLYTYIGDTAPGQMTGNGVDEWYVATTDLKPPTF
jgi:predicted lipoprotein with Yx(FWY)xxD motif